MIYVNIFCMIIAVLSLSYAMFHPYLFGEIALWYWNVLKKIFLWLKGFSK